MMANREDVFHFDEVSDENEERVTEFIGVELEKGSCLKTIKTLISQNFKCDLSSADTSFIESECIRLCFYSWHKSSLEHLETFLKSPNQDTTKILLNLFTSVTRLEDVPEVLRSKHFRFLIENLRIVDDSTEKKYIFSLKRYAVSLIEILNTGAKYEWRFIDLLLKYLQESYQNVSIFSEGFLRDSSSRHSLRNLIEFILNLNIVDDNFHELKQVAKQLSSAKEFVLEKEILETVNKCIKPAEVKICQVEGRWIIEVTGKYILLSAVKQAIEEAFEIAPKIEELRFVGVDMLYIDASLSTHHWNGKNVVVYANKIKIVEKVTWITSGADSTHKYETDAGTDANGEGVDGSDGHAGESGGNVLIIADEVLNTHNWKIISNGGKGSMGQNGGHGNDGKDGKGMEMSKLRDWERKVEVENEFSGTLTLQSGTEGFTGEWYKEFQHNDGFIIYTCYDIGYYVLFFYSHRLRLIKGTNGTTGGTGGASGLGGEGGFKGEIEFHSIGELSTEMIDGCAESQGVPGFDGLKGKDGCDIGYYRTVTEGTTYYGEDRSSKYCLEQFPNRNGNRVFNPHYRDNTNPYTGIVANGRVIQQSVSNKVRTTKSLTREKQVHAKASRKKKSVASQIRNLYSDLLDDFSRSDASRTQIRNEIESDQSSLKKIQEAEITETTSAVKARCKRVVPINTRNSNLFCKRLVTEERKGKGNVPPPSFRHFFMELSEKKLDIDELTASFTNFEISLGELSFIKHFIEQFVNDDQMNVFDKTQFSKTKNNYLEHFAYNATTSNAKLKCFLRNHSNFLKNSRIFFEAFENELMHHNAHLLPAWIQSQQSQWQTEDFEKKITSKPFLEKLYYRVKGFQQKEIHFTSVLEDSNIRNNFRQFAVQYFPSYSYQLFNGFKKIDFLKTVFIEKEKIAALKVISTRIEKEMETINNFDRDYNEESYLQRVSFENDKTDHGSLGRIHNYFYENNLINREKLAFFVEEAFVEYNKNWESLKSNKDYNEALNLRYETTSMMQSAKNKVKNIWQMSMGVAYIPVSLFKGSTSKQTVKYQEIKAHSEELEAFEAIEDINKATGIFQSATNKVKAFWGKSKEAAPLSDETTKEIAPEITLSKFKESFEKSQKLKALIEGTSEYEAMNYTNKRFLSPMLIFMSEIDTEDAEVQKFREEFSELSGLELNFASLAPDTFEHAALVDEIETFSNQLFSIMNKKLFKKIMKLKKIQDGFIKHILHNGVESKACRSLLANVYGTNMRVFKLNEDAHAALVENHNNDSRDVLRLCMVGRKEFVKMDINQEHMNLDNRRHSMSSAYKIILNDIKEKRSSQELSIYMKNETFLKVFQTPKSRSESSYQSNTDGALMIHPNSNPGEPQRKLPVYSFELVLDSFYEDSLKNILKYSRKQSTLNSTSKPNSNPRLDKNFIIACILKVLKTPTEQLKQKLEILANSGHEMLDVLEAILLCIQNNGVRVTIDELCVIFDIMIDTSLINKTLDPVLISWTLMTTPQELWCIRFILFQIENNLKKPIMGKEFYESLKSVKSIHVLVLLSQKLLLESEKLVESKLKLTLDSLRFMSQTSVKQLSTLNLTSWKYVGTEEYFRGQLNQLPNIQQQTTRKLMFYLMQMQSVLGTEPVLQLMNTLIIKKCSLDDDRLLEMFRNFHTNEWSLSDDVIKCLHKNPVTKWAIELNKIFACECAERSISELITIIKNNPNLSPNLRSGLHLAEKSAHDIYEKKFSYIMKYNQQDIESWRTQYDKSRTSLEETLAVILRAIQITTEKKVFLRPTQTLALIILLKHNKNILAQVSTGEGKSWIAVAAAIVKVLWKENIDIITSSKVLAERDATKPEHVKIFKLFKVSVGHNCSENESLRKIAYSSCQVIYGDLSNFQRDYLLDTFYNKNMLGGRKLQNVLIDEVDSMLLDKGNNILYMSHEIPNMDELSSIYTFIWEFINQKVNSEDDLRYILDRKVIKNEVLSDMFGSLTKQELSVYFNELSKTKINEIWHKLIDAGIINDSGRFLPTKPRNFDDMFEIKSPISVNRLMFIIEQNNKRSKQIYVPQHLISFVLLHLEKWIENALRAISMKDDKEYIVDVDHSSSGYDINPVIIIQDLDTGTDQFNSEWEDGLHQFLQLKHSCKLSEQSLKAVFISNVSYFKLYDIIIGMSGTLGTANERDKLNDIHATDYVVIPTFKPRKFEEEETKLCFNAEEWVETVCRESIRIAKTRSVLVIFETIYDLKQTRKLMNVSDKNLIIYDRSFNQPEISNLSTNKIILATNIAGRGTDITLSEALEDAGGLHIIITYLPNNVRIEQQAFGRAARCGAMGSGQMIVNCSAYGDCTHLLELKQQRDEIELERIENVSEYYINTIKLEEKLFTSFKSAFRNSRGTILETSDEKDVREIVKQNFLDSWSFWLDENSDNICKNKKDSNLECDLEASLTKLVEEHRKLKSDDLPQWINAMENNSFLSAPLVTASFLIKKMRSNIDASEWTKSSVLSPVTLITFSNHLHKKKRYHDQQMVLNKACQSDEQNLAANYFKCFAKSKLMSSLKNFYRHDSVLESLILFEKRKDLEYFNVAMLETIQKKTSKGLKQNSAFREQHETNNKLYDIFTESLMNIIGHNVFPESFTELFNGNSILSEKVYEDLIQTGLLTKPRIHFKAFMQPACDKISYSYGISPKVLRSFLETYNTKHFDSLEALRLKLQSEIQMPSCEDFWNLLLQQEKLIDEEKLLTVNVERLKQLDPSLLKVLQSCSKKKVSIDMSGRVSLYPIGEETCRMDDDGDKNDVKELEMLESVFRNYVPADKDYERLKRKQIVSINCIASPCSFCCEEIPFNKFDCMSREDFSLSEMPEEDIDKIIDTLVSSEVIHKVGNKYVLNMTSFDADELNLNELQVYKPQVLMLFNRFFIYSMALIKLEINLAENRENCFIQLPSQIHMKLMSDLIANHFIEPSRVCQDNFDNIAIKIDQLYGENSLGIHSIAQLLSTSSMIKFEDFLNPTKERQQFSPFNTIFGSLNPFLQLGVFQLNLFFYVNEKLLGPENENIEDTAKLTMQNQAMLYSKKTEIGDFLKTLVSYLRTKESPEINLKQLHEYTVTFENAIEIGAFKIKGLDQVMSIEEEKWTWKVIFRFTVVVIVGVLQIVIGSLITVLSIGSMTHVGTAFVNEGVGDLLFALSVIRTGHFTWKDYLQHKCFSLVMTVLCCGTSSLMTKGQVFLGFGHKVAGPTVKVGGIEVAKMSGMALFKEVGFKKIAAETFKQSLKSLINAARSSIVNFTIEKFMQSRVQTTIDSITQSINGNIHNKVENSSLSTTFEALFLKCGKDEAMKIIRKNLDKSFENKELQEAFKLLDSCASLAEIIAPILDSKLNTKWYGRIPLLITALNSSLIIYELMKYVDNAISKTNENLKKELKNAKTQKKSENRDELKNFQEDARRLMEGKINQNTSRVVSEKIIRPLMTILLNKIAVYAQNKAGGYIKACWRNKKEKEIRKKAMISIAKLKELKQKQNLTQQETMDQKTHTENLTKLMEQTRCQKMMGLLSRQSVPMNMISVQASVKVVENLLLRAGIDEKVQIEINNGDSSCTHGDENGKKISIDLSENHFGDGINSDYDCYYDALCKQIPEMSQISRSEFRSRIADVIEVDPDIAFVINQGWHEFSSSKGFYGGAKKEGPPQPLFPHTDQQFKECSNNYNVKNKYVYDKTKDYDIKYDFEKNIKNHGIVGEERENTMRNMALDKALETINNSLTSRGEKPLDFADFEATRWCKVEMMMEGDFAGYAYFPVELVKTVGGIKYEINMDNPAKTNPDGNGPKDAHVGYSIGTTGKQRATNGHIFFGATDTPTRDRDGPGYKMNKNVSTNAEVLREKAKMPVFYIAPQNINKIPSNVSLKMYSKIAQTGVISSKAPRQKDDFISRDSPF